MTSTGERTTDSPFLLRRIKPLRERLQLENLDHLLDQPWLQRAWTFQEVILSADCTILCGSKAILWEEPHRGLHFLCLPIDPKTRGQSPGIMKCSSSTEAWMDLFNIWLSTPHPSHWGDIELRKRPARGASVAVFAPIDRHNFVSDRSLVFTFVGFAMLTPFIVPAPLGIVFWPLAVWCRAVPRDPVTGAPSWVIAFPIILIYCVAVVLVWIWFYLFISFAFGPRPYPSLLFPHRDGRSMHLDGIARALRRDATQARDKSYALHGVLRAFGNIPAHPASSSMLTVSGPSARRTGSSSQP